MTPVGKRPKWLWGAVVGLAAGALAVGIVLNWPGGDRRDDHSQAFQQPEAVDTAETETPTLVSQPRPEFSLPDLSGTRHALKEWDGKVLAVNFWATWCGPCKEEIPLFNTLQSQYGPRGMQFIGVAMDDRESVQTYVKTHAIDYPVLVDGEDVAERLAIRYGDDQGVVPYTAFIDRQGRIAFIQFGAISQDLARQIIESLL